MALWLLVCDMRMVSTISMVQTAVKPRLLPDGIQELSMARPYGTISKMDSHIPDL